MQADHTTTRPFVVAVDGPSGSGKSSTARGVARHLGMRYLDTGAMYRAVTWWMLQHDVPVGDPAAVAAHCEKPELVSGTDPAAPTIHVGETDVVDHPGVGRILDPGGHGRKVRRRAGLR